MRKLLAAFLACFLWATPALATTIVTLGNHNQAASATNILTTVTNSCVAGSTVVLSSAYVVLADTLASVTDSAGNTWKTPFDNITGTGVGVGFAYAANTTADLPVGATITATFNGSTNTTIAAACVRSMTGTIATDTTAATSQGLAATSATTVNSGSLATSTDVAFGFLAAPTSQGTATCNGSYSKTGNSVTTPSITTCFQILASSSSLAFSPTWTNAVNYVSDLITFKGTSSTSSCSMSTLGVGAC